MDAAASAHPTLQASLTPPASPRLLDRVEILRNGTVVHTERPSGAKARSTGTIRRRRRAIKAVGIMSGSATGRWCGPRRSG
jgi:hypothetical protein